MQECAGSPNSVLDVHFDVGGRAPRPSSGPPSKPKPFLPTTEEAKAAAAAAEAVVRKNRLLEARNICRPCRAAASLGPDTRAGAFAFLWGFSRDMISFFKHVSEHGLAPCSQLRAREKAKAAVLARSYRDAAATREEERRVAQEARRQTLRLRLP